MMRRKGFTLVELVVVIMILGILAAVAAPKMFDTAGDAAENGLVQTLGVVRDAIELYAAQNNGDYPPGTDLAAELEDFIRGPFPSCPVGDKQDASVTTVTTEVATTGANPATSGWIYNSTDGTFICGSSQTSTVHGVPYDEL